MRLWAHLQLSVLLAMPLMAIGCGTNLQDDQAPDRPAETLNPQQPDGPGPRENPSIPGQPDVESQPTGSQDLGAGNGADSFPDIPTNLPERPNDPSSDDGPDYEYPEEPEMPEFEPADPSPEVEEEDESGDDAGETPEDPASDEEQDVVIEDPAEDDSASTGDNTGGGSGLPNITLPIGTVLKWMSERTCPAYVIMTANNVQMLPPEFTRKGRVDEIFGVYLPEEAERQEILAIHLRNRNRAPEQYDLDAVASAVDGTRVLTSSRWSSPG